MRISFSFLLVFVSGCYLSHERAMTDAAVPIADAGALDAGSDAADSGSIEPDAGPHGLLEVSLSPEWLPPSTIPQFACGVVLARFDFRASDLPVGVQGLQIHRVGIGATSDFSNLYLYDDRTGVRLTTGRTINRMTNLVEFNSLLHPFVVPSETTETLALVGDVGDAISGDQHAFEIVDASAVRLEDDATASGIFPIRGPEMTIAVVAAARLDLRLGIEPPDPMAGELEAEVSNIFLDANDADIELQAIRLLYAGSASYESLEPHVYIDGSPVDSWWSSENTLTIAPPTSTTFVIPAWTTSTVSVRMDISAEPGETIRFYVEYPADVNGFDRRFRSPAAVCISPMAIGGCMVEGQGSFDGSIPGTYSEVTVR